jgi:hypothetical protein
LEDVSIDGRMIIKYILKSERVNWIHVAQYRGKWLAPVTTIMDLQDP